MPTSTSSQHDKPTWATFVVHSCGLLPFTLQTCCHDDCFLLTCLLFHVVPPVMFDSRWRFRRKILLLRCGCFAPVRCTSFQIWDIPCSMLSLFVCVCAYMPGLHCPRGGGRYDHSENRLRTLAIRQEANKEVCVRPTRMM